MTIDVLYQGLTIAKGAPFRFEQGGLLVQVDGPMPVATELTLSREAGAEAATENQAPAGLTFTGRVHRVFERSSAGSDAAAATTTAGMLVFPTASRIFPRWVKQLLPDTAATAGAEFEPEPPPPPVAAVAAAEPEPEKAAEPEAKADAAEAKTDDTEAKADAAADAAPADAPASGRTPSEGGGESEEEDSKPSAKKAGTASKPKKKARKR